LVGAVDAKKLEIVAGIEAECASVLGQFLHGDDELQIECLTGFDAVAIDLERWPCADKC